MSNPERIDTMKFIAYHNDPQIKTGIIAQLVSHQKADEIVKGRYWADGKGCAVGCTLHSSDHMEYETRFGIPVMLARLEDTLFEGLPNARAQQWPVEFMSAIEPGSDLSLVGWKFLHWLLTDENANPGILDETVSNAIKQCAGVIKVIADGGQVDVAAARSAERSAARSAERSAAMSAARSAAMSAVYAAMSAAMSAARSAESAVYAARSAARSAAMSAARSAESAVWSAAAWGTVWNTAAMSAAYTLMANKLLELILKAPTCKQ
jgi:hypothetical protein